MVGCGFPVVGGGLWFSGARRERVSSRAKSRDLCALYEERREVASDRSWERVVLLSGATSQACARHVTHAQRSLDYARDDTGRLVDDTGASLRFRLRVATS